MLCSEVGLGPLLSFCWKRRIFSEMVAGSQLRLSVWVCLPCGLYWTVTSSWVGNAMASEKSILRRGTCVATFVFCVHACFGGRCHISQAVLRIPPLSFIIHENIWLQQTVYTARCHFHKWDVLCVCNDERLMWQEISTSWFFVSNSFFFGLPHFKNLPYFEALLQGQWLQVALKEY